MNPSPPPVPSLKTERSRPSLLLNDCHSSLNQTQVAEVHEPSNPIELSRCIASAASRGLPIATCGGRHAMGGQQFGREGMAIDCRGLNRLISLDREQGIVEVESGITWPELVSGLLAVQLDTEGPDWTITQKQTGADELTIGGALAANVHGRGLQRPPIVSDVESFQMMLADGNVAECSRTENPDLFSLAIGGYGLFGVICSVKLRLTPRRKVRRVVEVMQSDELPRMFDERIRDGFHYGDFQYAIDHESEDFLRKGVFSCYQPVDDDTPISEGGPRISGDDWKRLIYLAHVDKSRAFESYAGHYRKTDGQIYWSDEHQFTVYQNGYHRDIDTQLGSSTCGGEMITEIYVPRDELLSFLDAAREGLRSQGGNVIYGTVRLIERERETFLGWARQNWACVIFNLCVRHENAAIRKAQRSFRMLIDAGLERGGSYYLTYHRWARPDQVEKAYPQFSDFLQQKRHHDPAERFQSDWYRHYRDVFSG